MMLSLIYLLIPMTIFASYMHGRGDGPDLKKQWYESKGVYIAAMALLGAGLGFLSLGYWGLLGALVSPLYWFLFRTSRQAHAELSYMYLVKGYDLVNIGQQYLLPVGVTLIPILFAKLWITAALLPLLLLAVPLTALVTRLDEGYKQEEERSARAAVEIANGLLGGVAISGVLHAATILVG